MQAWYGAIVDAKDEPEHLEAVQKTWTSRCRAPQSLVFAPIWSPHGPHWTLLVVDCKTQECRYYDSLSLQQPGEETYGWMCADNICTELKKLENMQWLGKTCPGRTNHAVQGALECGFYVCWWMEAELRVARGERPFLRGLPQIGGHDGVRARLCSIFNNLEPSHKKMLEELQIAADADKAVEEAFNKEALEKAAATGAICKSLEEQATEAMFKNQPGIGLFFDVDAHGGLEHWAQQMLDSHLLLPAHEADALRVKAKGTFVCSSCHFSGGCYKCWWVKTVRYWRRKETRGELMEGYTAQAKAMAKGKAAAAGKPKGAAAKPKAGAAKAKADAGLPKLAAGGPLEQA